MPGTNPPSVQRREAYRGYVLEAAPMRPMVPAGASPANGQGWAARVVIELHNHDGAHFQEVRGDPFVAYATWEEAARASIELGHVILDSRPEAGSVQATPKAASHR